MNSSNNFRSNYYNDEYDETDNIKQNSKQTSNNKTSNTRVTERSGNNYSRNEASDSQNKANNKPGFSIKRTLLCALGGFLAFIILLLAVSWVMSLFVPQKTNFLIMATDKEGTRTDTIMLGTFDKETKNISLISIPRDTYITVSDENYEKMNRDFPQPGSQSMKINSVHHYGGAKYGVSMLKNEVERLTGLEIDFYVKVDFDAFRYIIDSIGGIEFYVPQNMNYSDPYQDLYIDLKQGNQVLNGEQCEHLLRFRSGYANADLGRIKVQQDFMKAFFSQTLSKGTILTNPGVFVKAIFKYNYLETDAGFFDVASYAMVIGGVNSENIATQTLPGYATMVDGQSVYKPDVSKIVNVVSEITNN